MPARLAFLDTNGWIALLNSSDTLHFHAEAAWTDLLKQDFSLVLTDWIVAETGNGLARTALRKQFVQSVEIIRSSKRAKVISISGSFLERALELYDSRSDKTWGLVDCASFMVMQDEEIQEALTDDRHFKQAGFNCLLPLL